MKIALPKDVTPRKAVILPLNGTTSEEVGKYNSKSFSLLVNPTGGAGSPEYRQNYRILTGNEDLRTKIQWIKDIGEVQRGTLTITVDPTKAIVKTLSNTAINAMFLQCLHELSLPRFESDMVLAEEADALAGNTALHDLLQRRGLEDHFDDVNQALVDTIGGNLPFKCLQKVKRYLRRECRKPYDMKAREYVNHMQRVNNEEIPFVPPGGLAQRLSVDEILDIILWGTPRSWQTEMDRQGFDPLDASIMEVTAFMERIEETEETPKKASANGNGNKKPAAKDWKTKDWKSQGKTTKYCSHHGNNTTHTTEECKVLQSKRFKGEGSSNYKGNSGKKPYNNKTWTKNADDSKRDSKKELNAIVKKAIAKGVKKELNAIQAKRKTDDSSDEDGELHMLEQAFDLKDFNYADMENLKIKEEDEVSV
jgi:hypothetical protein